METMVLFLSLDLNNSSNANGIVWDNDKLYVYYYLNNIVVAKLKTNLVKYFSNYFSFFIEQVYLKWMLIFQTTHGLKVYFF